MAAFFAPDKVVFNFMRISIHIIYILLCNGNICISFKISVIAILLLLLLIIRYLYFKHHYFIMTVSFLLYLNNFTYLIFIYTNDIYYT